MAKPSNVFDDGLICAFRIQDGRLSELAFPDLPGALADGDGVVWIHLNLASKPARRWVESCPSLPAAAREALLDMERRPRFERQGGDLSGTISDIRHGFAPTETVELEAMQFWLSPAVMITARHHPARTAQRLRERLEAGHRPSTGNQLLCALVEEIGETFHGPTLRLGNALDRIEDALLLHGSRELREPLGQLRREAVLLRRAIVPQHQALQRLIATHHGWRAASDRQDIEEAAGRLSAVVDDLEATQERAKVLQDELSAKLAEEANRNLLVLSIVTVLFMPLTLISGIFGMNLASLPWSEAPDGLLWVGGLMVAVVILTALLLRRWRRT